MEPVDFEGRRCPCAPGFACSQVLDVCCVPEELVTDFRVAWAAEQQIWWAWEPTAPAEAEFGGYFLVVTTTPTVLETYDPTAGAPAPEGTMRFDADSNRELAGLVVSGTAGTDFVRGTMTPGLTPNTTYYAQLFTLDGANCPWRSPVITARTTPELGITVDIYTDAEEANLFAGNDGGERPLIIAPDPRAEYEGDNAIVWDTSTFECRCAGSVVCARCSGNLKLNETSGAISVLDLSSRESSFSGAERRAILEVTVSHTSRAAHHFARTWIQFDPDGAGEEPCGGECGAYFRLEPFTMQGEGTQTFQFMLSELVYSVPVEPAPAPGCVVERRMTTADLRGTPGGGGATVCQFNFGAEWTHGSVVTLDDIRIRY